jgi:excisionase family DNA binding protein
MAEELISLKEAQEYLRVSGVKIWKLVKEGSLPVYTDPLDKRKKLVPRAEVEKLKEPQAVKKTAPTQPPKAKVVKQQPEPKPESRPVTKAEDKALSLPPEGKPFSIRD